MVTYDKAFYTMLAQTARRSARHIVPKVLACIRPTSVVDIGCGTGTWLSVFVENGVADFLGIDADFVPKEALEIPAERYMSFDLTHRYRSTRRFDLVVSLDVAEHLPSHCAVPFVESLVRLGPAVLFSAAIPGQGGTHHINEQWQDYWAELFGEHDYVPVDCIRKLVWNNDEVAWWYSQNILLYCERTYALANEALVRELEGARTLPLSIVHPRNLQEAVRRERFARAAFQLGRVIPPGGRFLVVDGATTGDAFNCCGQVVPFPQKDGVFAGHPVDSRSAIAEMQSLWSSVSHLVMVEPVFWWRCFYSDWFDYLRANSRLVLETEVMLVFELNSV